ncbi:MAG: spondin domain-containing protein [Gammaproteobacteria bacterium]|nr:spondin domain-containing protein [Gammaproteobacteria bacterium]
MKKTLIAALVSTSLLASVPAFARQVSVEITNLTNALYFTPLLVALHKPQQHLFQVGEMASDNLQAMAEGGNIAGLSLEVTDHGGRVVENPAGGLLGPGESTSADLQVKGRYRERLSITAMLLPTNDGFVGLDSLQIPRAHGTYTYYLQGYDAGTEANDEVINGGGAPGTPGIPADPGGNSGTGGTGIAGADYNPRVHVHRGILGDHDPNGGASDLTASVHRFQNPVARLVIKVGK